MAKYPIFVISLSLAGCIVQTAQHPKDTNTDFIAAIRERLTQVREMETLNGVAVVFERKDRANSYLNESLQGNSDADNLRDTSLAYAKLGLLPPGVDLRNNLLGFYSSQAVAFYDSRAKRVVLPVRDQSSPEGRVLGERDDKVIAHELVHAFQDQKFSIGNRLRVKGNGDATLALRSVAEGDATLSEYAYVFGDFDASLAGYARQMIDAGGENANLASMPMIVADRVRFQYFAGVRFVSRAFAESGWSSVNRLYNSPPLSTEQILHPEKYFDIPDPPTRIDLKNLSRLFPLPWREIESDTLGELSVHCLFYQYLEPSAAASIAQGWDGDRFVAYRKGDGVAFLWATIWDSETDAVEFLEGYQHILAKKYDLQPSGSHYYIEKRGLTVLIIEGLERQRIDNHIDSVWAEMVLEEAPFSRQAILLP
ncbi:MAG: hypothetical protein WD688_04260 [Candidatus Binatia bacterium]